MRPRIRIPLWAALAIPGAAYVVRSIVVRHGDFALDVADVVLVVILAAAVALTRWVREQARTEVDGPDQDPPTSGV